MKKWVGGAVAALLVLGTAWYWGSPALAMSSLRDALAKGDRTELNERIDFPAVRESLKSQITAMMTAEIAKQKEQGNPFAALGGMFATAMAGQMIDGIVTPDGIKSIVQSGKFKPDAAEQQRPEQQWTIEHDGFSRFRAVPNAKPGEKAPQMVFRRDGLGWKLVDIEMPKDGLSTVGS